VQIRSEQSGDEEQPYNLTAAVFEPINFSDGAEAGALYPLRRESKLILSLKSNTFSFCLHGLLAQFCKHSYTNIVLLAQFVFIVVKGETREEAKVNARASATVIRTVVHPSFHAQSARRKLLIR
jgi:hypothetical protein